MDGRYGAGGKLLNHHSQGRAGFFLLVGGVYYAIDEQEP